MKKKLLVIAIITAILFSFIACNNDDSGGSGNGSDSSGGGDERLKIEMLRINNGEFMMGSLYEGESTHKVILNTFYMSKYQITQEQYEAVMGNNPSSFKTNPQSGETQEKRPVENVTWYDAVEFCNKLSEMYAYEKVYTITGRTPATGYPITSATVVTADWTKNGYRLPTEAQWEYACRAGTITKYNTGDTLDNNTTWYSSNSGSKTHEVGKKNANVWGLYDMHGNVSEWCWDRYSGDYQSSDIPTDPTGSSAGSANTPRVNRGGNWKSSDQDALRSASRASLDPGSKDNTIGFRVVYIR